MDKIYRDKCMEALEKCDKLDTKLQSRILRLKLTDEIVKGNRKLALMLPKYLLLGAIDHDLIGNTADLISNLQIYDGNNNMVALAAVTGVTLYNMALIPVIMNDINSVKEYKRERKLLKEVNNKISH